MICSDTLPSLKQLFLTSSGIDVFKLKINVTGVTSV